MRARAGCRTALILAVLAVPTTLQASEAQLGEEPAPTDVESVKGGFEKKGTPLGSARLQSLRRRVLPAWMLESRLDLHLRTYLLDRDQHTTDPAAPEHDRQAWAYGGWLRWQSPWWFDHVNVETAVYTSQRLWGKPAKDGTRLLADGQEGYTVVGLANAKLRWRGDDAELVVYRQLLDLPFLNRRDDRMTPNTFEGVTVSSELEHWSVTGGFVWKMKERTSESFEPMSTVAGVPSVDRGLGFVGARYRWSEHTSAGFTNQLVRDVLNTFYAEASHWRVLRGEIGLRVEGQFTDQRSVGDDLLVGSAFDTRRIGVRATVTWRSYGLSLAYSWTDAAREIVSPYGSDPGYLSTMQNDFRAAGDRGVAVGLSHNFAAQGVPELTAVIKLIAGENPEVASGAGGDRREAETTFDYRVADGALEGLWLRFRASYLRDGPLRSTDVRFIANYDLPVF